MKTKDIKINWKTTFPTESKEYLVSLKSCKNLLDVRIISFFIKGNIWETPMGWSVVAWSEIPEPYKEI